MYCSTMAYSIILMTHFNKPPHVKEVDTNGDILDDVRTLIRTLAASDQATKLLEGVGLG